MKVLVTGATSIIGVPLVKALLQKNCEVYAVIRCKSKNRYKLGDVVNHPQLHIIELDLSQGALLPELIGEGCSVCVHLGWDGAGSENRKKREIQQKNVEDSLTIFKACHKMRCKRFIFSGSQAEYGLCHDLIDENTTCTPISEYGKAKIDFMNAAQKYLDEHVRLGDDMQYIHTRIFSIYGPMDHEGSLIESCISSFLHNNVMEMGKCEHFWNYLYIDDLIEAFIKLVYLESYSEHFIVYNIAADKDETRQLKEYVKIIHECCGKRGSLMFGARPENAEGAANLMPNIEKIIKDTGWKPRTSFEEGIKKIVNQRRADNEQKE